MNGLKEEFVKKFNRIMMEVGSAHSYLGMQIILKEGSAMIDMRHFIVMTAIGFLCTRVTKATVQDQKKLC